MTSLLMTVHVHVSSVHVCMIIMHVCVNFSKGKHMKLSILAIISRVDKRERVPNSSIPGLFEVQSTPAYV